MANTYTVQVVVKVVADEEMAAHGIILLTLGACKFTEILVEGPLVTIDAALCED